MTDAKAVSLMKLTKVQLLELYMEAQHKLDLIKLHLDDKEHTFIWKLLEIKKVFE